MSDSFSQRKSLFLMQLKYSIKNTFCFQIAQQSLPYKTSMNQGKRPGLSKIKMKLQLFFNSLTLVWLVHGKCCVYLFPFWAIKRLRLSPIPNRFGPKVWGLTNEYLQPLAPNSFPTLQLEFCAHRIILLPFVIRPHSKAN